MTRKMVITITDIPTELNFVKSKSTIITDYFVGWIM